MLPAAEHVAGLHVVELAVAFHHADALAQAGYQPAYGAGQLVFQSFDALVEAHFGRCGLVAAQQQHRFVVSTRAHHGIGKNDFLDAFAVFGGPEVGGFQALLKQALIEGVAGGFGAAGAGVDENIIQIGPAVHLEFGERFAHALLQAAEGGREIAGEVHRDGDRLLKVAQQLFGRVRHRVAFFLG